MFPPPVLKTYLCLHLLPQPSNPLQKRKCLCSSGQLLPEARDLVLFLLKDFAPAIILSTPLHWNHQFIPLYKIGLQASEHYSSLKTKQKQNSSLEPTFSVNYCSHVLSSTAKLLKKWMYSCSLHFITFYSFFNLVQQDIFLWLFVGLFFKNLLKGKELARRRKKNSLNAIQNVFFLNDVAQDFFIN